MRQTTTEQRPQIWVEDAKRRGEAIIKEAQEKGRKIQKGHDRPSPDKNMPARSCFTRTFT